MIKKAVAALALSTASLSYFPSAAIAQEAEATGTQSDDKIGAFADLFKDVFGPENNEPIDADALTEAEKMMLRVIPDGTYAEMLGDMMDRILSPLFGAIGNEGMSDLEIAVATSIGSEEFGELSDDNRSAVTALLDPARKERSKLFADGFVPIMKNAIGNMDPLVRNGLSRAYARKFSASELKELNRFFDTAVGRKYASKSFAIQADPEVMQASMKALPQMMQGMEGLFKELEEKEKALPQQRDLSGLNDDELKKLAGLLNVSFDKLKKEQSNFAYSAEVDADAVSDAAEDSNASEAGDEAWYDRANWSAAMKEKVEKADATYSSAGEAYDEAQAAYQEAFNEAVEEARSRLKGKTQ